MIELSVAGSIKNDDLLIRVDNSFESLTYLSIVGLGDKRATDRRHLLLKDEYTLLLWPAKFDDRDCRL